MRAYDYESGMEVHNFIGRWYDGQVMPQSLCLYVQGENDKYYIDYDPNIGSGMGVDEWNRLTLAFEIPLYVVSKREAGRIIDDLKRTLDELLESYDTEYKNGNNVGVWNEDLIEEIEDYFRKLDVTRFTTCFDNDGEYFAAEES